MRHLRNAPTLLVALALAACAASSSDDSAAENAAVSSGPLTLPLTAKSLVSQLKARGITTKADALAIMPFEMKERFVLVKNTGAIGVSSIDRPRAIMFEETGRFIVASSGHKVDEDITASSLEIIEEDAATHTYHAHTVTIDASGISMIEDDARCNNCHGASIRPIWGSYPEWPSAYGEHEDKMTPEEHAAFATFSAMAKTDPDYKHLDVHQYQTGFLLPTPYGFPNVQFGSAIGDRWAFQLSERMQKSPNYAKLANALVETSPALDCNTSGLSSFVDRMYSAAHFDAETKYPAHGVATKIYRLLGVEPSELHMDLTALDTPDHYEIGQSDFDVGSDYLTNAITFPIFADLVAKNPPLANLYASKRPAIDALMNMTVKGDRVALEALTRESAPNYYDANLPGFTTYIHQPVLKDEGKKDAVCDALDKAQRAVQ